MFDVLRLQDGVIRVFNKVAIDGSSNMMGNEINTRVQSHEHDDHGMDTFMMSFGLHKNVIMTEPTFELIKSRKKNQAKILEQRSNAIILDYEKKFILDEDYELTLHDNRHVLGSCQILIKNIKKEISFLYSSDIGPEIDKFPATDVLLLDKTCGHRNNTKSFEQSKEEFFGYLADLVRTHDGPISISAHRGTAEAIINDICDRFPDILIYAGLEIYNTFPTYRKYGYFLSNQIRKASKKEPIPEEISKYIFIASPKKANRFKHSHKNVFYLTLTGFHSNSTEYIIRSSNNSAECYITQHAGYETTIEYIRKTGAKKLIIDDIMNPDRAIHLKKDLTKDLPTNIHIDTLRGVSNKND